MSSTNRAGERVASDAYYTPDHVARACIAATGFDIRNRVWEPHAGGGAFVRASIEIGAHTFASDIHGHPIAVSDLSHPLRPLTHDALDGFPGLGDPDWIIGNPPFDEAQAHIEMAIRTATIGVAFLLRLGFLEGQERQDQFWQHHPCAEIRSFVRRPSFLERYEDGTIGPLRKRGKDGEIEMDKHGNPKKAGTDSAAYGWFIWRRGYTGPTIHRFLSWP